MGTPALTLLGIAYGKLNRYDDAKEAYREVVRIKPEDVNAWYNLGVAYFLSGNKISALDTVRELRRLDPEQADKLFDRIMSR